MAADAQRLADLEEQVAGLTARVEKLTREAFVLKTLQEIRADAGPGAFALQSAFDAGRASVSEGTPRPAARRPRHLQAVQGGAR
jgi:hypothetical protein